MSPDCVQPDIGLVVLGSAEGASLFFVEKKKAGTMAAPALKDACPALADTGQEWSGRKILRLRLPRAWQFA